MKAHFSKLKNGALFALILGLCASCFSSSSTAAPSLNDKVILFYSTKITGSPKIFLDHNIRFSFYSNGKYDVYYEGDYLHRGDYSYVVIAKNKARLIKTYSTNDGLYQDVLIMTYNSLTSGSWILTRSTNPLIYSSEEGTFKFQN